jgi:hypothetical protein
MCGAGLSQDHCLLHGCKVARLSVGDTQPECMGLQVRTIRDTCLISSFLFFWWAMPSAMCLTRVCAARVDQIR